MGGPREKYSLVGEDWGHNRVKIGFRRRKWKGEKQR